uniref:Uncharacterized protein n=1 Tax=Anopheles culicifacies TaxID=139723 RepID=A0A182MU89_9DIPT
MLDIRLCPQSRLGVLQSNWSSSMAEEIASPVFEWAGPMFESHSGHFPLGQLAEHPLGDVLDAYLPVGRRQIVLVAHDYHGYVLEVGPLLADLLEALLDAAKAGLGRGRVHEQERMGRRNREPSHGRKLHLTGRIKDRNRTEVILPVVEVFHRWPILVGIRFEQESLYDAAFANAGTTQNH